MRHAKAAIPIQLPNQNIDPYMNALVKNFFLLTHRYIILQEFRVRRLPFQSTKLTAIYILTLKICRDITQFRQQPLNQLKRDFLVYKPIIYIYVMMMAKGKKFETVFSSSLIPAPFLSGARYGSTKTTAVAQAQAFILCTLFRTNKQMSRRQN